MIDYTVVCDNCSVQIDSSQISPTAVRRIAIAEGTLVRHKRKDYCVSCAKLIFSKEQIDATNHRATGTTKREI